MNACDPVEMQIAANDPLAVLTRQRCNPQIIFRDGPPLLPKFVANSRVVDGSIQVDRKNDRSRDQQVKHASEARLLARPRQTVSIFTNHDGRKMMLRFEGENFCDVLIATQER